MKGIKELRSASVDRPLRVVIDEELPGDWFRILAASPSAKKPGVTVLDDWGEEEEHLVRKKELGELLNLEQPAWVREGQVFQLKGEDAVDLHEEVRKHVKKRTRPLLEREGTHGKKEGKK